MIDYCNEIFTTVAQRVRADHKGTTVAGEYTRMPSKFPMVTLDETQNITMDNLVDSSHVENYSGVAYRLQVFSNKQNGKKAQARAIFSTADDALRGMGLRRVTYTTTPEIYDSTIYSITATYEGVVSALGYVHKR